MYFVLRWGIREGDTMGLNEWSRDVIPLICFSFLFAFCFCLLVRLLRACVRALSRPACLSAFGLGTRYHSGKRGHCVSQRDDSHI